MRTVTLNDFIAHQDFFIKEAKMGKIFVYPTDTIYGIWWIYTEESIEKIFAIKQRDAKKMFSIIAPSFERIKENYQSSISNKELKNYLEEYHGVTYIFDYTKPGVRIIKHPFQDFVQKLWSPFITTSCNKAGEKVIIEVKDIPEEIKGRVDYIIDWGILWWKASVLIDFVADKIIER